jgi:phage repressor protein C with HTH and peptisase S24 domain
MSFDDRPEPAKRLEQARRARGFKNPKDAARFFGWKYETYIQHEQGHRGIGRQSAKYATAFRVSEGWLLTGEGSGPQVEHDHLSSEDIARSLSADQHREHNGSTTLEGYRGDLPNAIPEVDARAGAGSGSVGDHEVVTLQRGGSYVGHKVVSEWVFPSAFLRHELHAQPGAIIVLEVVGDSMSPTLESGDRVIIDTVHARPVPDGVYVIDEGDGPLVKRLQLIRRSEPPEIRIISDNKHHEAYTLRADDVRIIGRVTGRVSKM